MSRRGRIWLVSIAMVALLAAAGPTAAQARTAIGARASSYSAGIYAGKIIQVVPKPYIGTVSLGVSHGQISGLAITFGVACQGLGWVRDRDPMPTLTVDVGPTGGFSYVGKVAGRHLRLSGILSGHKVVGWFFQTFWLGSHFCTMSRPARYTASG